MAKTTKKQLDEITTAKLENVVKKPVSDDGSVNVSGIKFSIK